MKHLLKTFVLLAISTSSFAQLSKGNWLVGGSGSFYSSNTVSKNSAFRQKSDEFNLSIVPSIGYFFAERFAAGLNTNFSWGKGKGGDAIDSNGNIVGSGGESNIKKFLIGPFVRYYLLSTDKPFNILTSVNYQYGVLSFTPGKGSANNFSIAAGPVIYFNSSVGLEFTLGYVAQTEDAENAYETRRKGLQIGIGFQIHLEKE